MNLELLPKSDQLLDFVGFHISADSQVIHGFRGKGAAGEFIPDLLKHRDGFGIMLSADEIVAPSRQEHGGVFRGRQEALVVIDEEFFLIENIDVGGPDDAVFGDEVRRLIHIHLYRNEVFIDQSGHIKIRVRHGTQLGTSPSAVLKEIEQDRLFLLAGSP